MVLQINISYVVFFFAALENAGFLKMQSSLLWNPVVCPLAHYIADKTFGQTGDDFINIFEESNPKMSASS